MSARATLLSALVLSGCVSGYREQVNEVDEARGRLTTSLSSDASIDAILRGSPEDLEATLATGATLESVQDAAVRRNPDIVAALERWVGFIERVPQKIYPGPASGSSYPVPNVVYRYAPMLKMDEVVVSLGVPFPTKLVADVEGALAEARAARADFKESENGLRARAAAAYAQLYLSRRELEIVDNSLGLLDRLVEIAEAKFRVGTASLPDVLRAKVEREGLRADRATLTRAVVAARGALNLLLDRRPEESIGPLAKPPLPALSGELRRLLDRGLEERPWLDAATERVAAADAMHSRASQEWLPDFLLGVGYMYDFGTKNNFPEAVGGFTLPIFPSISARMRETEAQARQARAEARVTRNRVLDEITQAATRVDAAADRYWIFEKSAVPQAEEAIKAAEAAYTAKQIDFLGLVDTQRQLLMKQLDRERALAEYTIAHADMERAIGSKTSR